MQNYFYTRVQFCLQITFECDLVFHFFLCRIAFRWSQQKHASKRCIQWGIKHFLGAPQAVPIYHSCETGGKCHCYCARFRLTISEWFIWVEQLFSMTGKEQVTGKQCPFCFKKFSPQGWHTHVATHTMHAHLNADAISIPIKKETLWQSQSP